MNGDSVSSARKDRLPGINTRELRRFAEYAKTQLEQIEQASVPNEDLDIRLLTVAEAPANSAPIVIEDEGDSSSTEEAIHGQWKSSGGECRIFLDSMTRRLAYEELLGDGSRLHGWLVRKGSELCWQSTLWILDEDQTPWYGPSFGEEPDRVGDILVRLLPGRPVKIQTQIRVADEDNDWQPPVTFSQLA